MSFATLESFSLLKLAVVFSTVRSLERIQSGRLGPEHSRHSRNVSQQKRASYGKTATGEL